MQNTAKVEDAKWDNKQCKNFDFESIFYKI